ncbi:PASTA domain-containing protein [Nocardioides hankookensis]|uniref:PASTA domain-containing protein n=1 Tax=Nocardioides hankookensis TaxID=443157 RepID=A0ABW1LL23_9ACTN
MASTARPPAGTRWQGVNGVVVAVPRTWSTSTDPCRPVADSVWMTGSTTGTVPCPAVRAPGSGLQVGETTLGPMRHRTIVRGLRVRHSGVRCRASASGPCSLEFAVPGRDASFQVFYVGPHPMAFVTRLMRSVTLLPAGLTTVPAIGAGTAVQQALGLIEEAGLVGRAPQVDFPHYVTGTAPAAGRVVRAGATVRLTVGDG